jgi:uncharacterized small protein (DUF1192 family)
MRLSILLAYLRFQFYRHGWPAAAGLGLLIGAICLQLFGVDEIKARTADLQAEQAAQRLRAAPKPNADEAASQQRDTFVASLPAATEAVEAVAVIHRAATAHSVTLATGEYRLARDGSAPLVRYQITLPAHAGYQNLRAWLADVMNALPTAALDEIGFRRDDISGDAVEARVRLTLFLKAP